MVAMVATSPAERIAELERELKKTSQENRMLREEITWFENLLRLPASTMSPSEQKTVYALHKAAQGRDPDSFFKVDTHELSESVGQSQGTFLRNTATAAENLGVVEKKLEDVWYSNGVNEDGSDKRSKYTYLYVKPLELLDYPRLYTPQVERSHGGKREGAGRKPKCRTCQSERLAITEITKYRCLNCHDVWYEQGEEVLPDAANNQDEKVDAADSESSARKDSLTNNQDENENRPAEVQVDTLLPTKEDEQLETEDPVTPPPVSLGYRLSGFSLENWLRWGIGENNQKLIVATGKLEDDKKYISIPHNQLPNIDAYLQGKLAHIYGSAPLNTDDGTTRVLNWDIDDDEPERHERHETYMTKLAAAGAAPTYWKRRQLANGQWTAHLKLIFDAPVNAMAAYQWAIGIVPELAEIEECYPIGDRRINRLAWPLWYRTGNIVRECPAEIMFPYDQDAMISTGIESDRKRLTWLLSQAITPAALIPPLPPDEPTDDAAELGGALLDKPLVHRTAGFSDSDVLQQALAWWESGPGHDWEQIADVCNNRFLASWRKERTASVVIDDDRRYACDYGKHRGQWPKKIDRFDAWCLINGLDRRAEKERLCIAYRERQEVHA